MVTSRVNRRFVFSIVLVIILLGTGTLYYSLAEGWSPLDAFYFSTVTLTTIGFGDIAPATDAGKLFTSLYALFGIGVMLYILSSVIGVFIFKQEKYFDMLFFPRKIKQKIKRKEKELEKKEETIKKVEEKVKEEEKKVEEKAKEIKKEEKELEKKEKEIKKEEKEVKKEEKKVKKVEEKLEKKEEVIKKAEETKQRK